MNIIEAANILNIRHDADHMVVKAAFHALAKRNHPDMGGDTATMQRINEAHNYMSTRTQQARLAEWERLQPKPAHQPERQSWRVGQFDEYVATKMAEKANKAATSSHNPEPLRPGYTRLAHGNPRRRVCANAFIPGKLQAHGTSAGC